MQLSDGRITRKTIQALVREAAGDGEPPQSVLVEAMRHGSMALEYYLPVDEDRQQPHEQDELYVVQEGSALLEIEGAVLEVAAGDAVFVPAGARHRFHSFSPGFGTWVIFWGRKGGEARS
jgi:mannose-6-phosphate isomerase-like protein (cupin superfamily)